MKTIIILCLNTLLLNIAYSQLIENPKYNFEFLRFNLKRQDLQNRFVNVKLIPINDKVNGMMPKQDEEYISDIYKDTTFYRNASLGLFYNKRDSLLSMVQYIIAAENENETEDVERIINHLWDESLDRFGTPTSDKSIPFFGKIRKWSMEKIIISIVKTESEMRTISFTYKLK